MHVDAFIQTFAGEDTLSLLRCMAVANGNSPLDNVSLTEAEAKRFIIGYQSADRPRYTSRSGLADEIYAHFNSCASDAKSLEREVFHLHNPIQHVAAYFRSKPTAGANQKAINAFLACVTKSIGQAQRPSPQDRHRKTLCLWHQRHRRTLQRLPRHRPALQRHLPPARSHPERPQDYD